RKFLGALAQRNRRRRRSQTRRIPARVLGGGTGLRMTAMRPQQGSEPMLNKILLAAALASGVAVTAVPAVAQTADEGVMIARVVQPDGSMVVTRRFTEANGSVVDVTRTYRIDYVGVAPITPWHQYEGNSVSGGVGGAIGGYYIVGT